MERGTEEGRVVDRECEGRGQALGTQPEYGNTGMIERSDDGWDMDMVMNGYSGGE